MAKPANVIPSVVKKISIPMDLCTRMELDLHSDVECKIPYGKMSEFVVGLIRQHYKRTDSAVLQAHAATIE